jgi:methionine synthase II (cobalamin-independent)
MLVTSIGSLPFVDVDRAIDLIFKSCPEIPFWPQMPNRSFLEGMYVQCLERVPAVRVDEALEKVYVDTNAIEGIEAFYEDFNNERMDSFAVSEERAPGFYRFLERLPEIEDTTRYVKTQLTGPFTMGMGLKDESGRPIIYNAAYFDIIKKALHGKAQWMIRAIKARASGKEVILFFDEPAMVSFGSAFVSVSKQDVISMFDEVVQGLDALVGIHVCGNTDWSALLATKADIINYDAFNFMDTLFYFRSDLSAFLERGGGIAPGIVPSAAEDLDRTDLADLARQWQTIQQLFSKVGGGEKESWLATTSCGLGSLSEAYATRALDLLSRLADAVKAR